MTGQTINRLMSLAALAVCFLAVGHVAEAGASIGVENFNFEVTDQNGDPSLEAGAHPYQVTTTFAVDTFEENGKVLPAQSPKNILVNLPTGLAGNPTAVATCPEQKLEEAGKCPVESQVGFTILRAPASGLPPLYFPIFNMRPSPGVPAEFGFWAINVAVHLRAKVLTGEGYGVQVGVVDLPQTLPYLESTIALWGVPADPSHDAMRGSCLFFLGPTGGSCPTSAPRLPFLSNPTSCTGSVVVDGLINSWQDASFTQVTDTIESGGAPVGVDGCDAVPFKPKATVTPGSTGAGEPTSLEVRLEVPQQTENPLGRESSQVKTVEVDLPPGMAVNPAVADGLVGCSPSEIALADPAPPTCPAPSRIGSVEIATPLLDEPLEGGVYVATQGTNPFGSLLAMYVVVADPRTGVVLKLPGKVTPDPVTGQLHAGFDDNPQLPFETLQLKLKGGSRAPLVLPTSCGEYKTEVRMTPWARPAEAVSSQSVFEVSGNCDRGGQFTPALEAGTTNPVAGASSPFVLRVTRPDGQQNLSRIQATLPEGLLAKLKSVALCGEAQASAGDCPSASRLGSVIVAAGSGSSPLYLPEAGREPTAIHLAGPYKGAPYSLVVEVPAQAGPFDLGAVAVRNALRIDPVTTRVTAVSDPLPQILQGIPIAYRDLRVEINRSGFMLNPTSCRQMAVTSVLTSAEGQTATPSDRFQVAGCGELGFNPSLAISLKGAMKRSGNPALTAVLKAPRGQANIKKTTVALPQSMFIDNSHISNPCTRVQFNANACPKGSILGKATAFSPLLDEPLRGPVYFRSNGGDRELPDLVADLDGQIHVTLVGFIDSVKTGPETARVRTRIVNVPDAPVSKFVLKMAGGRKGLLENSVNLCKSPQTAAVQMEAQNAKTRAFSLPLGLKCGGR
ncbi:MAG TPA: hypothetical protein VLK37_12920 [Solirubrobacterales bacterium]|nr:hypothetical protein [Solirubrobacterales bacterium]